MLQVIYECQESGTRHFRASRQVEPGHEPAGHCDCCDNLVKLVKGTRPAYINDDGTPYYPLVLAKHDRAVLRDITFEEWRASA